MFVHILITIVLAVIAYVAVNRVAKDSTLAFISAALVLVVGVLTLGVAGY